MCGIPIDQIRILNPRHRDRRKFELIPESIKHLGLKKPIQISQPGKGENGDAGYDLLKDKKSKGCSAKKQVLGCFRDNSVALPCRRLLPP